MRPGPGRDTHREWRQLESDRQGGKGRRRASSSARRTSPPSLGHLRQSPAPSGSPEGPWRMPVRRLKANRPSRPASLPPGNEEEIRPPTNRLGLHPSWRSAPMVGLLRPRPPGYVAGEEIQELSARVGVVRKLAFPLSPRHSQRRASCASPESIARCVRVSPCLWLWIRGSLCCAAPRK